MNLELLKYHNLICIFLLLFMLGFISLFACYYIFVFACIIPHLHLHHVLSAKNYTYKKIYIHIVKKIYFIGEYVGRMSTKKTIVHFTVSTPDIKKLRIIKEKLPSGALDRFVIRYGNILDLLRVKVQEEAITALVQFYDPPLRCFTF